MGGFKGYYWCFTYNNPPGDWVPLEEHINYYCYQPEVGEQGTPHYQGYVEFKKQVSLKTAKAYLNSASIHVEARKGTREQAREYCTKDLSKNGDFVEWGVLSQENRVDFDVARDYVLGKRTWAEVLTDSTGKTHETIAKHHRWFKEVFVNKKQEIPKLTATEFDGVRPWQQQAIDFIKAPRVRRKILWIWSGASSVGKTTFQEYLQSEEICTIMVAATEWKRTLQSYQGEDVMWFALSRNTALSGKEFTVLKEQLEYASDGGQFTMSMYEGGKKVCYPKVIVTSNQMPPIYELPERITEIHIDSCNE
jgi:hypothetical protein